MPGRPGEERCEVRAVGRDPSPTPAEALRTKSILDVQQADRDAIKLGCRRHGEPFAHRSLAGDQRVVGVGVAGNDASGPRFGGLLAPPPTGALRDALLVEVMRFEIRDASGQPWEHGGLSSSARTRENEEHPYDATALTLPFGCAVIAFLCLGDTPERSQDP